MVSTKDEKNILSMHTHHNGKGVLVNNLQHPMKYKEDEEIVPRFSKDHLLWQPTAFPETKRADTRRMGCKKFHDRDGKTSFVEGLLSLDAVCAGFELGKA